MTGAPHADDPDPASREQQGALAPIPRGFEATGQPLGTGATAVVWPVRRLVDGREFALKVWRRPFSDASERERFRREVRQHAHLNRVSGHVVTYAWSEEDPAEGTPWIGTEQQGISLHDVLERGRPPLDESLVLGADLLQGLADMHQQDALHRDVKPANVLIQDGRAMLCDLGLVMDAAAYTADNAAGTPLFVAPELLDGVSPPSARTDVYSAARTVRELLGRDLPPALEQLLTAAASVNPADRPQDAAEFAAAFRQACADLGKPVAPPLLPPRAGASTAPAAGTPPAGRGSRRRGVVLGAGAAALLVVAAGVVFLPDWDRSDDGVPQTSNSDAELPDAGRAEPDITSDGRPVTLDVTTAGRCDAAVEGATLVDQIPYEVDGTVVAEVYAYYGPAKRQGCAKLVKPEGSPLLGAPTHLAVTLCGDANSCDHDWNVYSTDAGPVVVPSQDGCLSYRISMLDESGNDWLIRDEVGRVGCD